MKLNFERLPLICIGLCISALSGCVSWFYTPGMSELKRLCWVDGGDKIYQVVHTAGYFDVNGRCGSTCLEGLMRSDYQYIEYEETEKRFYHNSAMKEPGIWHIYKSTRDDPLCRPHLEKEFADFVNPFFKEFFSNQCLAARKLERPESRYWYRHGTTSRFLDKDEEVLFHTLQESIEDSANQQVLATRTYYRLVPHRKSALDYALTYDCEDAGIDIKIVQFPQDTLLPEKQGDKK
ncbi:MAG: hypothetical protein H7A00_00940 [Hahellaceae bacterium]|nr:hypothetical protein [Hahellaceae bacterium]